MDCFDELLTVERSPLILQFISCCMPWITTNVTIFFLPQHCKGQLYDGEVVDCFLPAVHRILKRNMVSAMLQIYSTSLLFCTVHVLFVVLLLVLILLPPTPQVFM